jgi:hypothetical protein
MDLKPGSRWKSAVCDTEIAVIRPPKVEASLECGGHKMIAMADAKPSGLSVRPDFAGGAQAGKRYADEASGLEVLCTKAGQGAIGFGGVLLLLKEAKPLPSSD